MTHVPYAHCLNCHFDVNYPDCGLTCLAYIEREIFARTVPPDEVAAVLVEPVLGEGSYVVPPPD